MMKKVLLLNCSSGCRGLFILDKGVGDVILLLFENEGLDNPEFRKLATNVIFFDLDIAGVTVLLMLDI